MVQEKIVNIIAPLTSHRVAPVIETDRLRLRPHQLQDVADCVAMWADPAIAKFTIGEPSPPGRTWSRLLAYAGHWALTGFGYWAVEERSSGRYLGEMGFADFKRDQYPAIGEMPELGWVLATYAHGRGFSTEGLRAIVVWGDRHFGDRSTACIINSDNERSLAVAAKLGYVAVTETSANRATTLILVRNSAMSNQRGVMKFASE